MKNRTSQTFLFLMAHLAINLPVYAQQVDYINLKIGDVLPNGDSLEYIRSVGESDDIDIKIYLFRNLKDGSFKPTVVNKDKVKHFKGDIYVIEKFGTIIESLANGDITIYDKEWNQTGKLNTRRDFGWKENWTDAGISPIYPYFLSDQYILLYQLNSLKIINKSGNVVFSKDYILDAMCTNFYYAEVQYLESGNAFVSIICNDNVQAYFLLVDTNAFKVISQAGTENIFPPDREYENFSRAFYAEKSGNLYISDRGNSTFITDLSRSYLRKIDASTDFLNYYPIEHNGETIIYSVSDKEKAFKKYSIKSGKNTGNFSLNIVYDKVYKDLYYTNKYVIGPNYIYLIVGEQISPRNRKLIVNGVVELSFDMKNNTFHPIDDSKKVNGEIWEKIYEQVRLIKK